MYCKNCGYEIDKSSKFCSNCGNEIKKETDGTTNEIIADTNNDLEEGIKIKSAKLVKTKVVVALVVGLIIVACASSVLVYKALNKPVSNSEAMSELQAPNDDNSNVSDSKKTIAEIIEYTINNPDTTTGRKYEPIVTKEQAEYLAEKAINIGDIEENGEILREGKMYYIMLNYVFDTSNERKTIAYIFIDSVNGEAFAWDLKAPDWTKIDNVDISTLEEDVVIPRSWDKVFNSSWFNNEGIENRIYAKGLHSRYNRNIDELYDYKFEEMHDRASIDDKLRNFLDRPVVSKEGNKTICRDAFTDTMLNNAAIVRIYEPVHSSLNRTELMLFDDDRSSFVSYKLDYDIMTIIEEGYYEFSGLE